MSWWIILLCIIAVPVALFLWMALVFGAAAWWNVRSIRKMDKKPEYIDIFNRD